jgi:glycosyltransferase involved in cell wall biosynthesis
MFVSVLMPCLNEEGNIEPSIKAVLGAFDLLASDSLSGELIVVDDGSQDNTLKIAIAKSKEDPRVLVRSHDRNQGIGAAFWTGFEHSHGNAVCLVPGDGQIDPVEILRYHRLIEQVDFVVPFSINAQTRTRFRRVLSWTYRKIVNMTFGTEFHYTNGAVLYKARMLKELAEVRKDPGFFFQTDLLVRAVKARHLYAEVPFRVDVRRAGRSTALSGRSFRGVCKGYLSLLAYLYLKRQTSRRSG